MIPTFLLELINSLQTSLTVPSPPTATKKSTLFFNALLVIFGISYLFLDN